MIQMALAILVVGGAVLFLGRRAYKALTPSSNGCSGCSSCAPSDLSTKSQD